MNVEFKLTPGYSPASAAPGAPIDLAMDFATACHRLPGRARAALVEVTIRQNSGQSSVPYSGKISVCATIQQLPAELSDDAADDEAMNYGAPIAFSMIRDEFLRLSGMTTFNRLLLPMVPRQALLSGTTFRDVDGKVLRQLSPETEPQL